ncbi:hypothetical protein SAMN05192534_11718 [Alteribacillus persepolensis]|uniref:GmrSD restriction endonucleases N-terminal domain-containing protein n=1 Tax=Alteribacillus persepolensis TaxID=568899 RepID=A0A1G8GUN0_9BACI|nr:DUF262 domain-containing protein [Alteribacillus persepolensis]SDH98033.1 hypothetical protein SAMN05192534_11718 [Alteribacillus persepolensis]
MQTVTSSLRNESYSYQQIINDIDSGYIKLPLFQREYVWTVNEAASLLDSIIKGYPIGGFVFWETEDYLGSIRNIGGIDLPADNKGKTNYVLDGQQRITSFYASLKGEKVKKGSQIQDFSQLYIDFTADAETEDIVVTDVEGLGEYEYISIRGLMDSNANAQFLRSCPDDVFQKLNTYKEKIMQYPFSIIIISHVPLYTATDVFTRINNSGKSLSIEEIMRARTYNAERNFDLFEQFDKVSARLDAVGYGTVKLRTILQLTAVILKENSLGRTILSLERDAFIDAWYEAVDALELAIDYLKRKNNVRVSNLLPTSAILIAYAYFFYLHHEPKPTETQSKYLEDFFWRVSLTGRYSSASAAKISQDVKRIREIYEDKQPNYKEYEPLGELTVEEMIAKGRFNANRGFVKAILCLYSSFQPRAFDDNSLVTLDNDWLKIATSKNYHHFFPKSFMKGKVDESRYDNVFNITLVDDFLNKSRIGRQAPADYMTKFKRENSQLEKTMTSHLIDLHHDGIFENDFETFIQNRTECVIKEIQKRIIEA